LNYIYKKDITKKILIEFKIREECIVDMYLSKQYQV